MARNTRKQRPPALPVEETGIRIRMYNVGFGDAFLVFISGRVPTLKILFDCGSVASAQVAMSEIVEQIVADATDEDGVARIDVVVATHRHKDHVSGFADGRWADVEVQEVWMPWTEDESDAEARKVRNAQRQLAMALSADIESALTIAGAAPPPDLRLSKQLVDNALMLSNEKAMQTLHYGFAGKPKRRFLPDVGPGARSFRCGALPDMRIHVMGPSRDPAVIRNMDPPRGQSYLQLRALASKQDAAIGPFRGTFAQAYSGTGTSLTPEEEQAVQSASSASSLAAAVALDKAVNGTSLMLLLETRGTHLLFPGDAQWGTWQAVLADPEWQALLARIAFYKIGHHGSHNATPREFVDEHMPEHIAAMASTLTRDIWPDIPRQPLLEALAAKHVNVIRSDQGPGARGDGRYFEMTIPV